MVSHPEFGHSTKATEVADAFSSQIKHRIVVITGVSKSGIGGEIALNFAKHDPELLILASRTQFKIDEVVSDIRSIKPDVNVKSVQVDLASQASVRKAAQEIKALTPRIDLLINNAGLSMVEHEYSPESIEYQFAVNHIGPFLLTSLLKDSLILAAKSSPSGSTRIINTSSHAHRASPFRFHDYNSEGKPVPPEETDSLQNWPAVFQQAVNGYNGFQVYGHTKTAVILFTVELNKRLAGTGVVSYTLHPGTIATELGRTMSDDAKEQLAEIIKHANSKSIEEGASTTLVAALDPALNSVKGVYLDDCQFVDAEPYAVELEKAAKLWSLSEEIVQQKF